MNAFLPSRDREGAVTGNLKQTFLRLLGKDPEAVVVSFLSGPEPLSRKMLDEVRTLIPNREHFAVTELKIGGVTCIEPKDARKALRRKRIGMAPVLFEGNAEHDPLRRLAARLAPFKILAFNARLERQHLRLRTCIASWLFLHAVPLDRIWLRPSWLMPWKNDRTREITSHELHEGRLFRQGRKRIGVLSPYFPYPLSHGGAVRIYNLLRHCARDFDIVLFAFSENAGDAANTPVLDFCSQVHLFPNPYYREPRWSTLLPPEVHEFDSDYVKGVVTQVRKDLDLLQVEYTQLAKYGGDVLVEHDVTFDLYDQIARKEKSLRSRWDAWRWRRFERAATAEFPRVVAMSDKDRELLGGPHTQVIPNGVDLDRFSPEPETANNTILFVGSFRHFPNLAAYRFFVEHVWPLLEGEIEFVVIAGPDPHLYIDPPADPRIELHGFVSDVRPFYSRANVVVVPTQASAGTNLKVLEAMAMQRAIVSTSSGCAGLELKHGESVLIADDPIEFAKQIHELLRDSEKRTRLAQNAREIAISTYSWANSARLQGKLWREAIAKAIVRKGTKHDLPAIERIQTQSYGASNWEPSTYFDFDLDVAEIDGAVQAFLVSRIVAPDEREVLNLAVAATYRRRGVASILVENIAENVIFLEVRESNGMARKLYEKLGFGVVGQRSEYYDNPVENALVMRLSRLELRDTF